MAGWPARQVPGLEYRPPRHYVSARLADAGGSVFPHSSMTNIRQQGVECGIFTESCNLHGHLSRTNVSAPAPAAPPEDPQPLLSIAATERETGLAKDTLRAWERRYGFPQPLRDARGQRGYSRAQVERLRRLRRLVAAGHRPGRLLGMTAAELDALDLPLAADPGDDATLPLAEGLAALRQGGAEGLRQWLEQALGRMGLQAFVMRGLAPLTRRIGQGWVQGEVQVYEEHLYTEAVQRVLRNALHPLRAAGADPRPRVLLTTVPGEAHGLGLLMVEALLTLEGAACLALGTQTPLADIDTAVRAQSVDIVALSFTDGLSPARIVAALAELRQLLPGDVALWAGGRAVSGGPAPAMGLADIAPALAAWRAHAGG